MPADVRRQRPPAQYVKTIVRYCIDSNIIDKANQLCNAYRNLARELKPFIKPPTDSTTTSDFIKVLEEKEEIWFDKFQIRAAPQRRLPPLSSRHSFPNKPTCTTEVDNKTEASTKPSTDMLQNHAAPQLFLTQPGPGYSFPKTSSRMPLPSQGEAFFYYRTQQALSRDLPQSSPADNL